MDTMKRFGFAAIVLVIGATLCAKAAAQSTYPLGSTGAEPGAAGQFTLSKFKLMGWGNTSPPFNTPWKSFRGTLTVTCQGLTPGVTYSTTAGSFKADRNGNGSAKVTRYPVTYYWDYYFGWRPDGGVSVSRINPDGSGTIILQAPMPFPPH